MSELAVHLEEYLRVRRALGHQLADAARLLPRFVDYLDAVGARGRSLWRLPSSGFNNLKLARRALSGSTAWARCAASLATCPGSTRRTRSRRLAW